MKEQGIRLNPFVYISETDIRFYLLILISVLLPTVWVLSYATIFSHIALLSFKIEGFETTVTVRLLAVIVLTALTFVLIYLGYRKCPKRIIKKTKLKELDPARFPEHLEYIKKLNTEHQLTKVQPTVLYKPLDYSDSAFTFGTRNHNYIGISGGLIIKFRKSINTFKSIILHELGHITNKDVEKTYFAAYTWWSLFLSSLIVLGILLLLPTYTGARVIYYGIQEGYPISEIMTKDVIPSIIPWAVAIGQNIFQAIALIVIIYILRNQIIRLREFYADARTLECEKSKEDIVKTLGGFGKELYSPFELLTKFHPNVRDRINTLNNNLSLFVPSLWVAFTVGLYYDLFRLISVYFYMYVLSDRYWETLFAGTKYQIPDKAITGSVLVSLVFVLPLLMLVISSSFHKSILRDAFILKNRYFSVKTLLTILKFAMVFALGRWAAVFITAPWIAFSFERLKIWALNTFDIAIILLFLSVFASMLIRRSYSRKSADTNFLIITGISILLSIIYLFVAFQMEYNITTRLLAVLVFSAATYTIIKIRDRRLYCPNCNNKISNPSGLKLNCPKCKHNLYSWAVYSFS